MELKSDIDDRALKYIQDTKPNIPILPMIHRWAFGTLQCLWKHRELTLIPRYGALGMMAVPQISLFQFLLTVLALLVDFALIWQLAVKATSCARPASIILPSWSSISAVQRPPSRSSGARNGPWCHGSCCSASATGSSYVRHRSEGAADRRSRAAGWLGQAGAEESTVTAAA